ncbi:hypothetical protein A9995_01670 [Erythrobacter sp. QSSC1-22B]|uniref:DUF3597 domain-containing protein n=1 Tax=Erythrobacter sp. QSSC1-22B TaxID=1860125 RepID=UPI0008053C49|nr:DUF3597 domain-containing protein [Erythrobacter sp. QSSC1-22B]OBX20861.1 hypothetical protein A9995_01670 [Erythrobacter sp. QSSC1-22B]
MGIFSSIKDAIFGTDPEPSKTRATQAPASPMPPPAVTTPGAGSIEEPNPGRAAGDRIDVENNLDSMPGSDRLNWRTSIVDLLKLINVDSDLESRKALAAELGLKDYTGSSEDNLWLHRKTMRALAESGGDVPAHYID